MESGNNDRLDCWLDRALDEHMNAEPTPGLERRILANLRQEMQRADRTSAASRLAWLYALGGAALVASLVAVWWHGRIYDQPELPAVVAPVTPPATTAVSGLKPPASTGGEDSRPPAYRTSSSQKMRAAERVQRREEFPSPRPLSEQEQLLVICVESHRDAAIFMAQAQTEFRQKEQQDMQRLSSESDEAQTPE